MNTKTDDNNKLKLTDSAIKALKKADRVTEYYDNECPGLFVRVHPTGLRAFYLNLPGRQRKSLGRFGNITTEQARELARTMLAEARLEKLSPIASAAAKARHAPTLRAFIDEHYGPWVTAHRKDAANTLIRLNKSFKPLLGQTINRLDARAVDAWRNKRLANVGPATANRDVTALRAVLSKAVEWNLLPRHPLKELKQMKVDNNVEPRWLEPEELTRLRATLCRLSVTGRNMEVLAAILVLLNTGLRRGELLSLQSKAYDKKRNTLTVVGSLSKTGQSRKVPLNVEAAAALDLMTLPYTGSLATMWTAMKRTFSAAKIAAGPHALRHTFARRLIDNGVSLPDVATLMGHADVKTTMKYVTSDAKSLAAAVNKL